MSMAEYMYKLLYGRKIGRAHFKGRHVNYISSSCSYGSDLVECNRSCSYAQTPYSGSGGSACHDVCPSWLIENNVYNSAADDGKGPRTPTSSTTTCQTPWWATGGSAVYPADPEGFYPQGSSSEEFPSTEIDVAPVAETPSGGNRKNCRFSSVSDSAESCSDDPPKFSQTLQFQISQHLWENLSLGGTPIDGDTNALQTQGVATGTEYLQYAGNADSSYLSSCSSASSSSLPTPYNAEVPYPYSPCRESNLSLGIFANDFQQTDLLYRATAPESAAEKADELSTLGYQRWNALCEQYCCCTDGSLYSCPLASGQKVVSNDGLYVGDREAGYNMASAGYDVKPEVKGIGRRMRCQMTSAAYDSGRLNSFSGAGRNSSRPPYFSIAATPVSSAISSSSSSSSTSSSVPQEATMSLAHTSAVSSSSSSSASKGLLLRPEVKMRESNQMCAVCGDNAACQHYGVRTCEGCKGFFKRTVQKGSKYVCLSGKNCPIDKRRRNRCQFCRFQKCLTVGMVKEVVRTDSLKGRRGRLPSKAKNSSSSSSSSASIASLVAVQHHHQQTTGVRSSPSATPQLTLLTDLLKAHVDTSPDLLNLDYSLYRAPSGEDDLNQTTPEAVEELYELLLESANTIRTWADRIPGVRQLTREDQETLVKGSLLELIVLRTSFGVELNDDRIVFLTGMVLHRAQCIAGFGAWIDRIIDFGRSIKSMDIDLPTMACLTALVLLKARRDLREPATVEVLYSNFKNALRDHCHSQGKHHLLPAIVAKLAELRTVCEEGVARLTTLKSIMEPPTSCPFDQFCSVDSIE